jgi:hypothetical protein
MKTRRSLNMILVLVATSGCAHAPSISSSPTIESSGAPQCQDRSSTEDDAVLAAASLVIEIAAATHPASWPALSGLVGRGQVSQALYTEVMRLAAVHGNVNKILSYWSPNPACQLNEVDLNELRAMLMAMSPDLDPEVAEEYQSRIDRLQWFLDDSAALEKVSIDPHNGSQSIALIRAHMEMIDRISNMAEEPSPEELVRSRRADRKARLKWCKSEPGAEECPFLLENERRRYAGEPALPLAAWSWKNRWNDPAIAEAVRQREEEEAVDKMVKNYTLGADGQPRLKTAWEKIWRQ